MKTKVKIAFVGCGFVSDYYMRTIAHYPILDLVAVYDQNINRAARFSKHYKIPFYKTYEEVLNNPDIKLIVNLTTPESHYHISKKALLAGKNVYSEKPFTLDQDQSEKLILLAQQKNLKISGAPCATLSTSAQNMLREINTHSIGQPRLAHIEMEDGPIHLMGADNWKNNFGIPWPVQSEFTLGSSLEHLGYALSWAIFLFGSVENCIGSSYCVLPEKKVGQGIYSSIDYSVAVLKHQSGVVTRITCGIVAPKNRGITITGDKGYLHLEDIWDNKSPVKKLLFTETRLKAARKAYIAKTWLGRRLFGLNPKKCKNSTSPKPTKKWSQSNNMKMDYLLGVNDLAEAILTNKPPQITPDFILEVNTLTLQINNQRIEKKAPRKPENDRSDYLLC